MNTVFNEVINQKTEARIVESYNVDEERELISMTRDGLISVINTVIKSCADQVTDPVEYHRIMMMQQ
jgi:hypothetical protein